MKDYAVSYYLNNLYHTYIVEAENEAQAIKEVLDRMPDTSKPLFHDFKIKQSETVWN